VESHKRIAWLKSSLTRTGSGPRSLWLRFPETAGTESTKVPFPSQGLLPDLHYSTRTYYSTVRQEVINCHAMCPTRLCAGKRERMWRDDVKRHCSLGFVCSSILASHQSQSLAASWPSRAFLCGSVMRAQAVRY
jgi:hypothetical protein